MALAREFLIEHSGGRADGIYPAILDVAQDHLLHYLHHRRMFDLGLVLKGSASLRKMRVGASGRFAVDLDFYTPNTSLAKLVIKAIDNVVVPPFRYVVSDWDDVTAPASRATLQVYGPFGASSAEATGTAAVSALEFYPQAPWLPPETRPFLPLPIHDSYELDGGLPALPVVRIEEAIAEKLARYARKLARHAQLASARDLYDLLLYARQGSLNQALIRRLWILKVYQDAVFDGLWPGCHFDPAQILAPRSRNEFSVESAGSLFYPVDISGWETEFRQRYHFLADLSSDEVEWASCRDGRRYRFIQTVQELGAATWLRH